VVWRVVLACELIVGETFAEHLAHSQFKALAIVHVLAVVEAEHLFVEIAKKMKRLYRNIRSMQPALYERPKVFHRVGMNFAMDVFNGMIDYLMLKMHVEADIRPERIRVKSGASFNVLVNQVMHVAFLPLRDNLCANFSATFHESDYYRLVFIYRTCHSCAAILMHVPCLAADKRFVHFNTAPTPAELGCVERVLQSKPKALKHKPCRLLRNTQRAVNLHARDAVLAVAEHPESGHPLVHAKRRILEDRSDFDRELLVATTAEKETPLSALDWIVLVRLATGAGDLAIRPTEFAGIFVATIRVAEVNDGFLQSLWRFHDSNVRQLFACVKYIFARDFSNLQTAYRRLDKSRHPAI
jgi:hypothetical protein